LPEVVSTVGQSPFLQEDRLREESAYRAQVSSGSSAVQSWPTYVKADHQVELLSKRAEREADECLEVAQELG
jgi:hypothetical protein